MRRSSSPTALLQRPDVLTAVAGRGTAIATTAALATTGRKLAEFSRRALSPPLSPATQGFDGLSRAAMAGPTTTATAALSCLAE